ncbi:MAG: hypothetical protein QOE62_3052 [Actinomycetota bacterium]|jgi:hypothetical protein|nr:hypothetical protein [Actinomycetota bacterium]
MDQEADRDLTPVAPASNLIGLGIGLVVGVPMMLVGAIGIWRHTDATPIGNYLKFFIGGDIIHDLVVAPIAVAVGFLVLRRVPPVVRAPLRAALFTSAVVIAVAWPGIRHYGRTRTPDNPSVQPLNYTTAALTAVGVVVAIAMVWLVISLLRAHRTFRATGRPKHGPDHP